MEKHMTKGINTKSLRWGMLALIFALIMGLAVLSGCSNEPADIIEEDILDAFPWADSGEQDNSNENNQVSDDDEINEIVEAIAPLPEIEDIVVARVNGMNIYERNVVFEIGRAERSLIWEYYDLFGGEWDEETEGEFFTGVMSGLIDTSILDYEREFRDGKTFGQVVLEEAAKFAAEIKVLLDYAHGIGIEITDESVNDINLHVASLVFEYGQEEFDALLVEDGIRGTAHLTEIFVDHWVLDRLIFILMTEPEEFIRFERYMLEDDCDANIRATALLERLHAGEDFVTLLLEYGEDPGMDAYPEGYTFVVGDMVLEFEEGTLALEVGEISGIVQTSFGYHIIMRVEPNPENIMQQSRFFMGDGDDELLGAMHILILSNEVPLDERMMDAIFLGFEEMNDASDVEFLPTLMDISVGGN